MIGKQFSTASITATAHYLRHSHQNVPESERVAWWTERNLPPAQDIGEAAEMMDNTASLRSRVEKPGYHFSVSFDPGDQPTREQMEAIADRLMKDLGIDEHQALIVAHKDREHPHFHVLVNRIHPETLQPWDRWQDRVKMQRSLRQLEREFSFREVPGRLHQLEGQEPPQQYHVPSWQIQRHRATGQMPFQEALKAGRVHREIGIATGWKDLEDRLAKLGLELKKVGRGIRITDGQESVKASAVDRAASLGRLEKRFDETYTSYLAVAEERPDPQPARQMVERLRFDLQAWTHLQDAIEKEKEAFAPQEARLSQLLEERGRLPGGGRVHELANEIGQLRPEEELLARLGHVYAKPAAAKEAIGTSIRVNGMPATLEEFRDRPEAYGRLPVIKRRQAREKAAQISGEMESKMVRRAKLEDALHQAESMNQRIMSITQAKQDLALEQLHQQYRLSKGIKSQIRRMVKQRIPGGAYIALAAAAVTSPQLLPARLVQQLALDIGRAAHKAMRQEMRQGPSMEM